MQILPPEVSTPRILSTRVQMADAQAEHRRRVAEVAYSLGASRGFAGGIEDAIDDWIRAEEIVEERGSGASAFRAQLF